MNSTFTNSTISRASKSEVGLLENIYPVELTPNASPSEIETVIHTVYRQVLGNAHIMESERLTIAESQFRLGAICVREFVRWVAKSELYKSQFIDNCPRYRSHELNFKHLLGRAPDDYQETSHHSQILDNHGYEADIDSYIDSDEYLEAFGDNIVPYYRGYQTQIGKKLLGYTNMFKMRQSISTSDRAGKSGNAPRLVKPLIRNNPNGNVPVTDINALLQRVFKQKEQPATTKSTLNVEQSKSESQALDSQTLEKEIIELEKQLLEIRSFATIGAAGVSKWQSYYVDLNETSPSFDRINRSLTQKERIVQLKQEIAQAKGLASLGEARLNKWRNRVFK